MRSQNRKVKITRPGLTSASVGRVSCLGLLALGFILLSPVSSSAVFAEEDYGVDAQALTASTVNIAFSPSSASGSLTPVDASGAKTKVDVLATVKVANSTGFRVYIGSDTSDLVNKSCPSTATAEQCKVQSVSSATSYAALPANRWGYALIKNGTSSSDTTTYEAMPSSLRDKALDTVTETNRQEKTFSYLLSFAANIDADRPAGTYENKVTMSVVSSPIEITNAFGIEYMQDMTASICSGAEKGTTDQLIDRRDNKKYWVTKMEDGNCWMTQNLDLSLAKSTALTSETTDLGYNTTKANAYPDTTVSWTPGFDTTTKLTGWYDSSDANHYYETRSWTQQDTTGKLQYIYTNPNSNTSCSSSDTGDEGLAATNCSSSFRQIDTSVYTASTEPDFYTRTSYTGTKGGTCTKVVNTAISSATSGECAQYDAHYLVGNWYQWNAAVAGTGGSDVKSSAATVEGIVDAISSICPKNWRLPTSGGTADVKPFNQKYSFGALLKAYGGNGNSTTAQNNIQTNILTKSPYFFVRSGYLPEGYLYTSGEYAPYWSSTAYTNTSIAYLLTVGTATDIRPSFTSSRYYGRSVRCVAR